MARRPRSMNEAARVRRAQYAAKRRGLWLRKSYPAGEWYLMETDQHMLVRTLPDLEAVEAWLSTKK
jgi:hypothetical protein